MQMPSAPKLTDLSCYLDKLPPMIARKRVDYFTGGAVSPKKLANDDSLGCGPAVRQIVNGSVVYPTEHLLAYLEQNGVRTIVVPSLGRRPHA